MAEFEGAIGPIARCLKVGEPDLLRSLAQPKADLAHANSANCRACALGSLVARIGRLCRGFLG